MPYILGPNSVVKLNGIDISSQSFSADLKYAHNVLSERLSGLSHTSHELGRELSGLTLRVEHSDVIQALLDKVGGLDSFPVFVQPSSLLRSRFQADYQLAEVSPVPISPGRVSAIDLRLVPVGMLHKGLLTLNDYQEGAGQVLTDYSGNGFNGELGTTSGSDTNDPTWATSPGRLSFTTDDLVEVTDQAAFDNPEGTAMAAVKLDATSDAGAHYIMSRASHMSIYQSTALWAVLGVTDNGNGSASFSIADTNWHVLAGVSEIVGADMVFRLYLDGELKASDTVSGATTLLATNTPWRYGATTTGNYLEGDIIRTAVFNRALQAGDVLAYYEDWREQLSRLNVTLP